VPNVHRHACQRLAREVGDAALHEHPLARQRGRDIGAMRRHLVLADIERAEHRGLGGALALPVVDGIDQHRHAEHIGEQDELLPDRSALLTGPGQEIDRIFPFLESKIGPADIVVQRFHQFLQQEFGARIRRIVETADHGGGQFGLVELRHLGCPAGYAMAGVSLYHRPAPVKHGRLEQGALFGYQGRIAAGDQCRC
jgi:hypothetical protein